MLNPRILLAVLVAALGIVARFFVSTLGWTQDWNYAQQSLGLFRVGDWHALTTGVWVTWGPVLLYTTIALSHLPIPFGWALVGFATIADLATAALLWWRVSFLAAALFFLNPISIVISGYQRVGDSAIVALAFGAILLYERRHEWLAMVVLSLSLLCKPMMFLLPAWFIIRPGVSWRSRALWVLPWALWATALWLYSPSLFAGLHGYVSSNNPPFWSMFDVGHITRWLDYRELMVVAVALSGLWYRRSEPLELFCLYTICLVAYAAALQDHYLIIAMIGLVIGWNRWAAAYTALGGLFELSSEQGLHLNALQYWFPAGGDSTGAMPVYRALVVLLLLHLVTREVVTC